MKIREIVREAIDALMRTVLQKEIIYVALSAILLCIAGYDAEASSQPNLCFQSAHASWMPLDPNGFAHLKRRCDEGDANAWEKGWRLHPANAAPIQSSRSRTQSTSQSKSRSRSRSRSSTYDRYPGCPSVTYWPSGMVIVNCHFTDDGGERTFDRREGAPGAMVFEN